MRALLSRGVLRLRALGGHFIAAGPLIHSLSRPAATARLLLGSARRRPEPWSAREGAGGQARSGGRSPKRRRAGRPGRGGGARGRSPAERASAWCPRRWRRRMRGAAAAVTAPPAPPPRTPPPRAGAAGGTRATSGPYQPRGLRRGPTLDPSPSLVSPPLAPRSGPPAGAAWALGARAAEGGAQGTPSLARGMRARPPARPPAHPAHSPPSLHPGCSGAWFGSLSQRAIVSRLGCWGWGVVARGWFCGTKTELETRVWPPAWFRTIRSGYRAESPGACQRGGPPVGTVSFFKDMSSC